MITPSVNNVKRYDSQAWPPNGLRCVTQVFSSSTHCINTLLIQQVLAEPGWANRLTKEDLRALTPLFYSHVNPYGLIHLDMGHRLPIDDPKMA